MADRVTLAELRYDAGLSPEELGKKVRVSGRTIRRIEDGHRPTPQVAKKLAKHFDLKPTELFPREPERDAA